MSPPTNNTEFTTDKSVQTATSFTMANTTVYTLNRKRHGTYGVEKSYLDLHH